MDLSDQVVRLPTSSIIIKREERQRRVITTEDIDDSIAKRGVLNPILIHRDGTLVAGERRLTSCIKQGIPSILCRYFDTLSGLEAQIIELEENIKRKDLPWQDEVRAVGKYHELALREAESEGKTWSQNDTAEALCIPAYEISRRLRIFREIDSPKVAGAAGITAAYNILARADERVMGDVLSEIIEAGVKVTEERPSDGQTIISNSTASGQISTPGILNTSVKVNGTTKLVVLPAAESILQENFLSWVETYEGPRFNFIHCDFPYGINVFGGSMSGRDTQVTYDDSPEVYWRLIAALGRNLDRIMAHSAHLMFWYSMEYHTETLEAFRKVAPSLSFNPFPLVWVKSDNVGILPDAKRGPRRVYETALIASREDRFIAKPVANAYSAPTDKLYHTSTKPEPVLRHFFQMFVDENTSILDPTCGSGSALRAAESLGAKRVLGLEIDEESCGKARSALTQFRVLRSSAK